MCIRMFKCFYCPVGKQAFDFHSKCAVPLKNIVIDCGVVVLHSFSLGYATCCRLSV